MATLSWIGKERVVNHHLEVPVRELKSAYSFGLPETSAADAHSENKIIHGDSLDALKALLPQYEGQVKCCYLDPPYNTGNEGWVYNDNVNDPRIQKWLGAVVGKEGEDFSRHDKWLCMMYPRLKLVQKLLADDGAVFISIDDNEQPALRLICDEIFGANCFIANVAWQRTYATRNDSRGVVQESESIVAYSKRSGWQPNKLARSSEMDKKYKNPDGDISPWRSSDALAPDSVAHQTMVYAIQNPFTGALLYPTAGRHYAIDQNKILESLKGWCEYELRDINDAGKRAEVCGIPVDAVRAGVKAIMVSGDLEEAKSSAENVLAKGPWPKFFFSKNGAGGIARKTYLTDVGGVPPTNLWMYEEVGHTDEASKEIKSIFHGAFPFETPKPTRLIERVLKIATNKDSLVLDCFAGSGTTAHAVLKANAADGGNRKFILVEMCDYAESVTAERVKRVIKGYGEGKNAVVGTGGDFTFYEIGEPIFVGEELNPAADVEAVKDYVWFAETQLRRPVETESALLGVNFGTAYYFWHDAEEPVILNRRLLHEIKTKAEAYVIYADLCALGEAELQKFRITFKKVSRDIVRI